MTTQIDQTSSVAAPSIAVISTMVGITLWPFALATVFAVCALVYQDQMKPTKAFANVIVSALIGGAVSQIIAVPVLYAIIRFLPFLSDWAVSAEQPMVAMIAIIFGLVAHVLIPKILKYISMFGSKA